MWARIWTEREGRPAHGSFTVLVRNAMTIPNGSPTQSTGQLETMVLAHRQISPTKMVDVI